MWRVFNAAGTSVADGANSDLLVTLGTAASTSPLNSANSANGRATLAGLFNYDGLNAGLMNLFNAAAALDSSAAGNHAGAQLSPTANASAATQASTASTVQVLNVAAAHLDGLRTAQNDSAGSGVATGESARNTGLWGQAFGGSSRLGERDDVAGYHSRYSGFLLGADAALNDSWRAGGLFSYTKTTVEQRRRQLWQFRRREVLRPVRLCQLPRQSVVPGPVARCDSAPVRHSA